MLPDEACLHQLAQNPIERAVLDFSDFSEDRRFRACFAEGLQVEGLQHLALIRAQVIALNLGGVLPWHDHGSYFAPR